MQGGSSAEACYLNPSTWRGNWLNFSLLLRSPELAIGQEARFPGHPKTDVEGTGISKYMFYLFGFGDFAQKDFDRPTDCLIVSF